MINLSANPLSNVIVIEDARQTFFKSEDGNFVVIAYEFPEAGGTILALLERCHHASVDFYYSHEEIWDELYGYYSSYFNANDCGVEGVSWSSLERKEMVNLYFANRYEEAVSIIKSMVDLSNVAVVRQTEGRLIVE